MQFACTAGTIAYRMVELSFHFLQNGDHS